MTSPKTSKSQKYHKCAQISSNSTTFAPIPISFHLKMSIENMNRWHKWKDLSEWLLFFCEWIFFFISCMLQFSFPYQWAWMNGSDLFLFLFCHQNGNFLFHRDDFYLPFNDDCPQSFTFFLLSCLSHDEQHKWLCWWKFYETFIISSFNNNLNSLPFIKCRKSLVFRI